MTFDELIKETERCVEEKRLVIMKMPPAGRAARRRIWGQWGPTGKVLQTGFEYDVVQFDADKVLAWIKSLQ